MNNPVEMKKNRMPIITNIHEKKGETLSQIVFSMSVKSNIYNI